MQIPQRQTSMGPEEHEIVDRLVEHIGIYQREVIVNYYTALKAKQFVILAGPPDVDKMCLAKGLAETLVGWPSLQWCSFQAHPWWTTQTGLPGYYAVAHTQFNAMKLLDCIEAAEASEAVGLPFLVGIERMSPAEMVCYFQDLPDGLLWQADGSTRRIRLPKNLYITGTLDVEEKDGLVFSPEVYRRAAIIQVERSHFAPPAVPRKTWQWRPDWQRRFVANIPRRDFRAPTSGQSTSLGTRG